MSEEFENGSFVLSDGTSAEEAEKMLSEDYENGGNDRVTADIADADLQNVLIQQDAQNAEKKKGKGGRAAKKVCALVLSGVLFGAVAGGSLYGTDYLLNKYNDKSVSADNHESTDNGSKNSDGGTGNQLTSSDSKATGQNAALLTQTGDNLTVSEIAENCLPSVVAITNLGVSEISTFWGSYEQESQSCGSGVIIGKTDEELIILTNYHVVSGSKELTVVFSFDEDSEDMEAVTANVKGYDAERDIAVIAIDINDIDEETLNSLKIAVIGDSENLKLGEQVVAIGNALGSGQSVTTGIVSATNRFVELEGTDGTTISNYCIQTDAAINPGNSGGELLNMRGELIGINSAKVSSNQVEGMGYAIPISDIYDLVNELMSREVRKSLSEEEQGYLCISGGDVDSTAVQLYGVPEGAYVSAVYDDTAAKNAGIEEGDIITEVNGVAVGSMSELKKELSYYEGGAEITVTVMRLNSRKGYTEEKFDVVLDDYDAFLDLQESLSSGSGRSK